MEKTQKHKRTFWNCVRLWAGPFENPCHRQHIQTTIPYHLTSIHHTTAAHSRWLLIWKPVFLCANLKCYFCSVITPSRSMKLCIFSAITFLHTSRSSKSWKSCYLCIRWVMRHYRISAVAMKQRLMSVAMHVGCWSVPGGIHSNTVMSMNSRQISSSALYRSDIIHVFICVCLVHSSVHGVCESFANVSEKLLI